MIENGLLDWAGVADRMSTRPARIGRLSGQGGEITVGSPANLVLVDPASRWVVEPSGLASKSRNTPYQGRELPVRVVHTYLRGKQTVVDGKPA